MPHCWPQKQQCVLTSRSGSALVDSRAPAGTDRCGPNRSMMRRSSTGIVATLLSRRQPRSQAVAPRAALREPEQRAPAARTNLLVVVGAGHFIGKTQLALDGCEVAHHHGRRERPVAAAAARLLAAR